ncbi:hypothetical protein NHX12_017382 [Muraenolepis orangiensis]|uniref:Transcription initiation factor TFIID component TAF4 C-terminal domain-containing protein n=1 Tax=Muraenolepis orangiensis TaxID=630683 RepID=A0A9Q0I3A1_9TELE|nr:hypothetical protein NHX12_017382 [Muraenolepis orangiensis]
MSPANFVCAVHFLRDDDINDVASMGGLDLSEESPGSGSAAAQPGASNGGGGSRQFTRQRITRVNLRDLLFCLEKERETGHSHLLP